MTTLLLPVPPVAAEPVVLPAPASALLGRALEPAALHQAWQRVQANAGAAGVDGQSIARFGQALGDELQQLRLDVSSGRYAPQALRLVPIPKKHGGQRMLAIPTVRDRVLQTAVAQQLGPLLDPEFDPASYAYRPGRSVAQAIARVVSYRNAGLQQVVDADIEGFFDHIDHQRLLRTLRLRVADESLCALVALWLAAVLDDGSAQTRLQVCGVAQGSPLSPLLANLYLDDFDQALQAAGLALVRYADDFVVLCADAEQAAAALQLVRHTLAGLQLQLNEQKTRLSSFTRGFEFLGVRFQLNLVEAIDPDAGPWVLPDYWSTQAAARHEQERRQALPPEHPPVAAPAPAPRRSTPSEPGAGRLLESLDPALEVDDEPDEAEDEDDIWLQARRDKAAPLLQTLYVGEPGCWLTKEHDRVVVSRQHSVRASVPLGQLDQIAIMDNAMVSTALLRHCASRRVTVAIGGSGGELLTLERGALADQRLARAQWQAQDDPDLQLMLARCMVEGKLHNSRTVLRRFTRHDGREAMAPHLEAIERAQRRLDTATDLDSVRGLEGLAARHHFEGLRLLLPEGIDFPGRQRRPPRDPVNVTLSLGYAVLAHNLHTLVRLEGLNAHIGHLHATSPGSLALVSDLMEEFRAPVVDAVALTLWRQGDLVDADFEWHTVPDELPCRLRTAARRRYIDALEAKLESRFVHPVARRMMDLRRAMQTQVRHYLRVLLRQENVYRPLKLR